MIDLKYLDEDISTGGGGGSKDLKTENRLYRTEIESESVSQLSIMSSFLERATSYVLHRNR